MNSHNSTNPIKAFLFAAGKGTRLAPFTNHHPKALAKVNGITLLERNIIFLKNHHIQDFIINIHHFGEQIIDFIQQKNYFDSNIIFSDEKEELLETGGALLYAYNNNLIQDNENVLLFNTDILTSLNISNLIDFHLKKNNMATLAVSDRNSSRKLFFNHEMNLCGWKNENTHQEIFIPNSKEESKPLAFSGIHCINSSILKKFTRKGKFSIIDEYLDLMEKNPIKAYLHNDEIIDVGKPENIILAEKKYL